MAVFNLFKRLVNQAPTGDERRADQRVRATLGARVLVVDDSATIRAVLGKMLVQDGYEVLKAVDGEAAVDMAQSQFPDLVFLDIVLPGMSGFAVLRALRRDTRTRTMPIVMMSGNQQATEQFYVQRFGADAFIKKPFGRVDVFHAIRALVQAGRMSARIEAASVSAIPEGVTVEEWNAIPDVGMPDEAHMVAQRAPERGANAIAGESPLPAANPPIETRGGVWTLAPQRDPYTVADEASIPVEAPLPDVHDEARIGAPDSHPAEVADETSIPVEAPLPDVHDEARIGAPDLHPAEIADEAAIPPTHAPLLETHGEAGFEAAATELEVGSGMQARNQPELPPQVESGDSPVTASKAYDALMSDAHPAPVRDAVHWWSIPAASMAMRPTLGVGLHMASTAAAPWTVLVHVRPLSKAASTRVR